MNFVLDHTTRDFAPFITIQNLINQKGVSQVCQNVFCISRSLQVGVFRGRCCNVESSADCLGLLKSGLQCLRTYEYSQQ